MSYSLKSTVHYTHIQHYHTQRSTVSNILVLTEAAILAFVAFDKALDSSDRYLLVVIMFLGLFGVAFSWKYYERTVQRHSIYEAYRDAIDRDVLETTDYLSKLEADAKEAHLNTYPRMKDKWRWEFLRVSSLWMLFHGVFVIFGGYLLYRAECSPILPPETQAVKQVVMPSPTPTQIPIPVATVSVPISTPNSSPTPTIKPVRSRNGLATNKN